MQNVSNQEVPVTPTTEVTEDSMLHWQRREISTAEPLLTAKDEEKKIKLTRIYHKFMEKFPELDHTIAQETAADVIITRFTDEKTQMYFEIFQKGWMSHPNSLNKAHVIAKLTKDGLRFGAIPFVFDTYNRAMTSKNRLMKVNKKNGEEAMMVIFSAGADVLAQLQDATGKPYGKLRAKTTDLGTKINIVHDEMKEENGSETE